VFNAQLSTGQINLVANYLSSEYGLPFAYETNLLFSTAALLGDHNHDGVVDGADYTLWRKTGINGQQGYLDWRANYGATVAGFSSGSSAGAGSAAVPEPEALMIVVVGIFAGGLSRRGFQRRFRRN
jgi:hypothetical protein